jgi:hypothetical protein
VKLLQTHGEIRLDMAKLQQAAYAAAFIEQATETETPLPEIFELVQGFISHLCAQLPAPQNIFAFELKLLRELGQEPDLKETRLSPGAKKIVQALLMSDWTSNSRLKLSDAQSDEISQWLHGFLIFHLDKLPRGRAMALAT